jgi:hypothetical protein
MKKNRMKRNRYRMKERRMKETNHITGMDTFSTTGDSATQREVGAVPGHRESFERMDAEEVR